MELSEKIGPKVTKWSFADIDDLMGTLKSACTCNKSLPQLRPNFEDEFLGDLLAIEMK